MKKFWDKFIETRPKYRYSKNLKNLLDYLFAKAAGTIDRSYKADIVLKVLSKELNMSKETLKNQLEILVEEGFVVKKSYSGRNGYTEIEFFIKNQKGIQNG